MIAPSARPRLVARARLRRDRVRGGELLLAPEHGFRLSPSAAAIARRLDGRATVAEIAGALAEVHGAPRERVLEDVLAFLEALAARGLVEDAA